MAEGGYLEMPRYASEPPFPKKVPLYDLKDFFSGTTTEIALCISAFFCLLADFIALIGLSAPTYCYQ